MNFAPVPLKFGCLVMLRRWRSRTVSRLGRSEGSGEAERRFGRSAISLKAGTEPGFRRRFPQ